MREWLRILFQRDGFEVLIADDGLTAREIVAREFVDVVLTDIRMPPSRTDEGLRVAEVCRHAAPPIGVLLLSQYTNAGYVKALLAHGTEGRGYLLKERVGDVDEVLLMAREAAAWGRCVLDADAPSLDVYLAESCA